MMKDSPSSSLVVEHSLPPLIVLAPWLLASSNRD
jgi:hypothetical protein